MVADEAMWGLLLNFVEMGWWCCISLVFDLFSFLLGQAIFIDCYIINTVANQLILGGPSLRFSSQILSSLSSIVCSVCIICLVFPQ